jgi:hypothetical protein
MTKSTTTKVSKKVVAAAISKVIKSRNNWPVVIA